MADLDQLERDTKLVGGDLGERRLEALPERRDADLDREGPVCCRRDRRSLERADRVGFHVRGDADADALAARTTAVAVGPRLLVPALAEEPLEEAGEVAALVDDRRRR